MNTIRDIAEEIVALAEARARHLRKEDAIDEVAQTIMTAFNREWQHRDPHFYDPDKLRAGIKVEKEHTPHADIATQIAMDHIDEFFDYYDYLELMEKLMAKGIPVEETRLAIFRAFGRVL